MRKDIAFKTEDGVTLRGWLSWQWFTETGKSRVPAWRNEVTLQSVELSTEYTPSGPPPIPSSRRTYR